jgi:hypothetical protein
MSQKRKNADVDDGDDLPCGQREAPEDRMPPPKKGKGKGKKDHVVIRVKIPGVEEPYTLSEEQNKAVSLYDTLHSDNETESFKAHILLYLALCPKWMPKKMGKEYKPKFDHEEDEKFGVIFAKIMATQSLKPNERIPTVVMMKIIVGSCMNKHRDRADTDISAPEQSIFRQIYEPTVLKQMVFCIESMEKRTPIDGETSLTWKVCSSGNNRWFLDETHTPLLNLTQIKMTEEVEVADIGEGDFEMF